MRVMNFGQPALADSAHIQNAVRNIIDRSAVRTDTIIVASAMAGVDRQLAAAERNYRARKTLDARVRMLGTLAHHAQVARELGLEELEGVPVAEWLYGTSGALQILNSDDISPDEGSRRIRALGSSLGAVVLASAIRKNWVAAAAFVDPKLCIAAERRPNGFGICLPETKSGVMRLVGGMLARKTVPVVAASIAALPGGETATFGNHGGDLTAAALAKVVGASAIVLLKEHPGLFVNDPHLHADTLRYARLPYALAADRFAKGQNAVLHPEALRIAEDAVESPAKPNSIPIIVSSIEGYPHGRQTWIEQCGEAAILGSRQQRIV